MNLYICSAKRTPIGSYGKSLKDVPAVTLGVTAAKAAIEQAGVDVAAIDETITGCVLQGGLGQNIGRQIMVGAGLPITTPAMTMPTRYMGSTPSARPPSMPITSLTSRMVAPRTAGRDSRKE